MLIQKIIVIGDTNLLPMLAFVPWWPYDRYAFAGQRRSLAGRARWPLRTWHAQLPFRSLKSHTHVSLLSFFARRAFDALKAKHVDYKTTRTNRQTITLKAAVPEIYVQRRRGVRVSPRG